MTTVNGVGAAGSAPQPAVTGAASLDYEAFLKLLVAQLENQDPTKPMESTEFVAQLATFSQVEQSINTNTKLDALLTSSSLELAGSLVGRTVTSGDRTVTGEVVSVRVTGEGPVATLDNGATLTLGEGVTIDR